ncbi:nucleotidyltransferase [Hapalosiphon sp. MRB220]|nr:nucleotidyltransferase [Hapalosiphon sp. MRB220]
MRDDREKLADILEAIQRIDRYAIQGKQSFAENELIQTWFIQHLQVIGEASRALSNDVRVQHPEVPWSQIIGMRNILTHNYFEIDLDVVWSVIERDLPNLKP